MNRIEVPMSWAGRYRNLPDGRKVWTCGACPDPQRCLESEQCKRAVNLGVLPLRRHEGR